MLININASELKCLIETKSVILIDVREYFEYNDGYIANSINIPLSELTSPMFNDDVISENTKDTKEIVLICAAGVRSVKAYHKLMEQNDFPNIIFKNLQGGISGWILNEYEIVKK